MLDFCPSSWNIHRLKRDPTAHASPHDIISKEHELFVDGLPVVAFQFSKQFREEYPEIPQEAISTFLRMKGYIIPNYPLPPAYEDQEVLRVVVRASHTVDLLDKLMADIVKVVQRLIASVNEYRDPRTKQSERSAQLYAMLAKAVEADSSQIEHEDLWEIDEDSGTRSTHPTAC
jgi:glutamate decarboxylase